MARLLRPTPAPLHLGIAVAAAFIALETLLVYWLKQVAPETAYGALFLLGVLVISAGWGFGLSVVTSVLSAVVYFYFHLEQSGSIVVSDARDFVAPLVFLPVALAANVLGRQARLRATESEQRRHEADVAASLAHALAEQQASLRRVATLVARGLPPAQVFSAAVLELSDSLGVANVALLRYTPDGAYIVVGARDERGNPIIAKGERLSLDGDTVASRIRRERRPARLDSFDGVEGTTAARIRGGGLRSAVGAPVIVDDKIWGALIVGCTSREPLPPGTEESIGDFADLVSTAIANAETRAELTASRARIVAASDQARRRFERDLHDGAQQRVVSLGLELRGVEASVPPDLPQLREQISNAVCGLAAVAADLREISRGIHPAILSRGGLCPAIHALARRCPVPVTVDMNVHERMPEPVEVAAYYVVAEALTNAAKHAGASEIRVHASARSGNLHLVIGDDGVGGATVGGGSGLIGLKDRVEALAGRLDVVSPFGSGTMVTASIPLSCSGVETA
ncbi:histidine kinase [Mycobacterium sp. 1274761.0]|nr:histidine kinase [Mycobacterium sp. 1274761.0]